MVELYFIVTAAVYDVTYNFYGFLLIALILQVIVGASETIILLQYQLIRENYHWWWPSFIHGGGAGLYVFAYALFYYYNHPTAAGTANYFGYMAVVSYAFFIMLGFVGFYSSFTFVNYIYGAVKTD